MWKLHGEEWKLRLEVHETLVTFCETQSLFESCRSTFDVFWLEESLTTIWFCLWRKLVFCVNFGRKVGRPCPLVHGLCSMYHICVIPIHIPGRYKIAWMPSTLDANKITSDDKRYRSCQRYPKFRPEPQLNMDCPYGPLKDAAVLISASLRRPSEPPAVACRLEESFPLFGRPP